MFSFKRFFRQFKINILQNAYRHGLFLLVICLFLIINHYHYFYFGGFERRDMLNSAGFVIIIMSILISIDMFKNLARTDSGINYLMMPATTIEKYLAAWVYSTLFTFVIIITTYFVIHVTSMFIGNLITGLHLPYQYFEPSRLWNFFIKMMFFQSFYFLGALLFKKNSFIKTTAALFFLMILISITGSFIIKNYFELSNSNIGDSLNLNFNGDNSEIMSPNIPASIEYVGEIVKTILYIIPFICWSAAYLKLKNTQI
jgi:hypothetical protein